MCAVYQIRVEGTYICNPRHENHDNKKIVVIKYAKNRQIYTYRGFGTTVDKAHVPSENRKIFHKEYTLNTEIRHTSDLQLKFGITNTSRLYQVHDTRKLLNYTTRNMLLIHRIYT